MKQPSVQTRVFFDGRSIPVQLIGGIAAGLSLGFAQPGWGFPGWGPFSVVLLWVALSGKGWRTRLLIGWSAGSVAAATAVGRSAAIGLEGYFELNGLQLGAAWLLADQVLGGLPIAIIALIAGDLRGMSAGRGASRVAGAWVLGEAARDALFPGAWLPLAAGLSPLPVLLGAVSWIGAMGVGGFLAAVSFLIARSLREADRRAGIGALVLLTVGIMLPLLMRGAIAEWRVSPASDSAPRDGELEEAEAGRDGVRVVLVQTGMDARAPDAEERGDGARLDALVALTREAGPADLVIWPEGAVRAVWPQNLELLRRRLGDPRDPRALLVGAPWIEPRSQPPIQSVGAVLLDSEGKFVARHLKTRLVPLAEGPGPAGWPDWVSPKRSFTAAERPVLLDVAHLRVGAAICYEALFASLAREQVAEGADLLVHLSNESWLGQETRGPDQMLAAAVLRAIETGRPVLRATTTGITAAIDGDGRVSGRLPRGRPGTLRIESRLSDAPITTFYSRIGDGPVIMVAILLTLWGRPTKSESA